MKMKSGNERKKIIRELLNRTDQEFTDEELIHQLIMTNITENSNETEKLSFGQRASDAVAKFAGSWAFIFSFIAVMVGWMAVNVILGTKAFDAYPFILLNLVLSCIAAIQAPLIMMSQNRQEAKDRQRAENDFKVNLKSELIIDDLHKKMDLIIENQKKINHAGTDRQGYRHAKSRIPYPQCLIQNKNVPWHIRAVTCDNLHLHASTQIFRSTVFLYCGFYTGEFYYGCRK